MKSGWLEIELKSELCAASGDSTSGIVDTDLAHEYGLPLIPAKRIKGCLREVGMELYSLGLEEAFATLFGRPGQQHTSALHIQDAHLFVVPGLGGQSEHVIDEYELVRAEMKARSVQAQQQMLDELTLLRTRTAIDRELGSAQEGTLRTLRVLPSQIKLRSRIELVTDSRIDDTKQLDLERLLEYCAKGLRNLGYGRTRGLGEVRCQIKWNEEQPLKSAKIENSSSEVSFRLHLEQPILIAGSSGLYHSSASRIPGSVLLGALAGMYIAQEKLGNQAHQDESFRRIFLEDGVKFGYALPCVNDQVFAPCPAAWQSVKNEKLAYDLSGGGEAQQTEGESEPQLRTISGYVYREGTKLYKYEPKKEVRMHHSRPQNRNYGHPKGPDVGANEGQFFQYTALSQGQVFQGALQGEERDLEKLLDVLQAYNHTLRLGRSRTAEYGKVRFERIEKGSSVLSKPTEWDQDESTEQRTLLLTLLSPLLLLDESGRAEADPELLIPELQRKLGQTIKLGQRRLKFGTLAGYHAQWRMPKPQLPVLEAGTTLMIEKLEGTFSAKEIRQIEEMRWGQQTGEGCGVIRVLPVMSKAIRMEFTSLESSNKPKQNPNKSNFLKEMQKQIDVKKERQKQYAEGRTQAKALMETEKMKPIGQTKLRQLWALVQQGPDELQKCLKESKESNGKLEGYVWLLKPFTKKENDKTEYTSEFVDGYFQALIWKARERHAD